MSNGRAVGVPLTGGTGVTSPDQVERVPRRRGTTNGNARGSVTDRERRREWLVITYRADCDVTLVAGLVFPAPLGQYTPACRCYRCGRLLTVDTVTVDRIIPGCRGGTYKRSNIRPSCQPCASVTGAALGNERKRSSTTTRRKGRRS